MPSKKTVRRKKAEKGKKEKKGFFSGKVMLMGTAGVGILLLALSATAAASRASELSSDLSVETSGRIHKLELSGLTLAVDVTVKNPSRTSVTFRHPFVKLRSGGKDLLSSEINSSLYSVERYGEKKFTLYFKTSLPALSMMLPALAKEYFSKGTLTLEVYEKTELTAVGGIALVEPFPYPKTDTITFGSRAKA